VAASGGYYIAAAADEILASPATITGSIGIFAAFPTVNRTLDKLGISVDGVGTTPLSGQLRLDRPVGKEAAQLLQAIIERGYDEFLLRVAEGRKKTRAQVDAVAQGRVWSGQDAVQAGLVDKLGSVDDAIRSAAKRAGLAEGAYEIDYYEPEFSWAEELALRIRSLAVRALLHESEAQRTLARVVRAADPLQKELERWARIRSRTNLYSYCFCDVR
jgi:protease-4